ncbi:hypothetical protein [Shinella sp. DD12]|uniref:hypothetical protein n=1 Tax=Shinella sp. DD12 TaxID=1410620 RepID=UPI0012DEC0BE|nr:hypothetical protein [Shinella sp. DD12]
MERIAPNLNMWLWRPIVADPPIYTQADLRNWVTLQDVMDAHEALDLKGAMQEKARQA